eukprot:TRINITY_DN22062_c0_g1_i1.p1 TRINITY_DN22062_c0_g1~~TRINITY_DN22062_c0_g1_i1.p1  ORF type:complete len:611 (-),score=72.24 TRINITY_DN22062_c0_g1_i1:29-1840(-)
MTDAHRKSSRKTPQTPRKHKKKKEKKRAERKKSARLSKKKRAMTIDSVLQSLDCGNSARYNITTPLTINDLPEEVLTQILAYLPHFPDLVRMSRVCRLWLEVATSEPLWKGVDLGNYEKLASDRLVVWIAALNPNLEVLSLRGCTQVTDVGLSAVLGRCSNLKELCLEDLERQFTVRCLLMIGKLCPQLEVLALPGMLEEYPDEVIQPIIQYCTNLKVFKSFSQFSDTTLRCLAENCKNLRKLRVGTTTKSTRLTQAAVKQLTKCHRLESLELGYFTLGVVNWGKPMHSLGSFKAFGWLNMTPKALRSLLENTPNLRTLHLIHSYGEENGGANNVGGNNVGGAGVGVPVAGGLTAFANSTTTTSFRFQEYISTSCKELSDINLCDTPLAEKDLATLVQECRNLKKIRVGMKSNPSTRYEITDSWLVQWIQTASAKETHRIQVLKIYHADIKTDTIALVTRKCRALRELTLGRCSPLTAFVSELHVVPPLTKLSLRNTKTRDSALQMLLNGFPNVRALTLIETGVSDALIGFIVGRYRLRSLKLQQRMRLTNEGKVLYKGRAYSSRGGRKKQTLTEQQKTFLSLFQTEQFLHYQKLGRPSKKPK